eukprot:TRINITY_DN3351_c0_g1_i1.p1 TRINITY_DN3351_c0_g1~~TRINITY_DN3351_c0_g1_i1.p1  ORF type:complete len:867 (-),score=79.16 TRINITY_DN3351_c0_g1_i1:59-2659(-)
MWQRLSFASLADSSQLPIRPRLLLVSSTTPSNVIFHTQHTQPSTHHTPHSTHQNTRLFSTIMISGTSYGEDTTTTTRTRVCPRPFLCWPLTQTHSYSSLGTRVTESVSASTSNSQKVPLFVQQNRVGFHIAALCKQSPDRLDEAIKLFKSSKPDAVGTASIISALAKRRRDLDGAWKAYDRLVSVSPQLLNAVVVNALVSACRICSQPERAVPLLQFVLPERNTTRLLDVLGFHQFAAACGESGDANAARLLCDWITSHHRNDTDITSQINATDCGQLCKALIAGNTLDCAFKLWRWMCTVVPRPIEPSANFYTLLLKGCSEARDIQRGRKVHEALLHSGRPAINDFLAAALIRLYTECGCKDEIMQIVDRHRTVLGRSAWQGVIRAHLTQGHETEALRISADQFMGDNDPTSSIEPPSLASIISACHNLALGNKLHSFVKKRKDLYASPLVRAALISMYARCNNHIAVIDLFKDGTTSSRAPPSSYELSAVLSACGDIGWLPFGRSIHNKFIDVEASRLQDNTTSALIFMYARCGSLQEAREVFDKLCTNNNPSILVWNAIMGAYSDHRMPDKVLALFNDMTRREVQPDRRTLNTVLNVYSHTGNCQSALEMIDTMSKRFGISPDTHHHTCVVDALGRAGRLAEASQYITKHFPSDSPTANTAWKAFLGACRTHHDLQHAKVAYHHLAKTHDDDAAAQVLMANIYAANRDWDEAQRIRQSMKARKVYKLPGLSNISVGDSVHEFMAGDRRHPESSEIHDYLHQLWQEMKAAGYQPLTNTVIHDVSEEEKDSHLCHHSEKLAIAYGLMHLRPDEPLVVTKNLRICPDCHQATAFIARMKRRPITVRDANCWHYFSETDTCSCNNYW